MSRDELKEIILRVIDRLQQGQEEGAPTPACIFRDNGGEPCDTTTRYAIDEED